MQKQLSLDKHLVILGTSFIGMEAAAYCFSKCASVTVIGRDSAPLEATFGAEIGERVKQEFESKGLNLNSLSILKNLFESFFK